MKKIFLSIIFVSAAVMSFSQFSSGVLTASGLTCSMCTKAIYNSLQKISFVSKVDADIQNSAFALSFKTGSSVDPDVLKEAVEKAGFSVSRLDLTGTFDHVQVGTADHVNIGGSIYHLMDAEHVAALNGRKTLTIVDKKFISAKQFKKLEASGHLCLESGKREACCPKDDMAHSGRIYHATL